MANKTPQDEPTAITFSRQTDQLYADVLATLKGGTDYHFFSTPDAVYIDSTSDGDDGWYVRRLPDALGQLVAQAL